MDDQKSAADPPELDVRAIQNQIRAFVDARDWEQFHTPKNLVMALAGEVAELAEHFQWLTPEESAAAMGRPEVAEAIREEMADVLYYVLRLADVLGIHLGTAVEAKMAKNELKHPVESSRGIATAKKSN